MMTETDYRNVKALILKAPLTGMEAITVAILLQKLDAEIAGCLRTPPLASETNTTTEAG